MNDKLKMTLLILFATLGPFVLWIGFHIGWLLYDGLNDEDAKVSLGIVYSLQDIERVRDIPPAMKARLDLTVEQYKSSQIRYVLVSGGVTPRGQFSATMMGRYLLSQKVPTEDIFVDIKGYTLKDIAHNARQIWKAKELNSIKLITDYWQVMRAKAAFQSEGFLQVQAVHPKSYAFSDVGFIWREFYLFYTDWWSS